MEHCKKERIMVVITMRISIILRWKEMNSIDSYHPAAAAHPSQSAQSSTWALARACAASGRHGIGRVDVPCPRSWDPISGNKNRSFCDVSKPNRLKLTETSNCSVIFLSSLFLPALPATHPMIFPRCSQPRSPWRHDS